MSCWPGKSITRTRLTSWNANRSQVLPRGICCAPLCMWKRVVTPPGRSRAATRRVRAARAKPRPATDHGGCSPEMTWALIRAEDTRRSDGGGSRAACPHQLHQVWLNHTVLSKRPLLCGFADRPDTSFPGKLLSGMDSNHDKRPQRGLVLPLHHRHTDGEPISPAPRAKQKQALCCLPIFAYLADFLKGGPATP